MKQDRKFHYDEQEGVFVFEDEISVNWLLAQVLNSPNLQITKVSIEELNTFISLLSNSDLRMPIGQHSLFWLKDQIKEKMLMTSSKLGESWHQLESKYRFIIERIDLVLADTKDLHEKMEIKEEILLKKPIRQPNNMESHFEPI